MTLSRSKPLEANRDHDWGEPDDRGFRHCEKRGCTGRWWWLASPNDPPRYACSGGLKRSELETTRGLDRGRPPKRRARLKDVSPNRERKRSSAVTGERLVFTEAADWARDQGCYLRFWTDHSCESYPGRAAVERCHLDRRGKGHGDWRAKDGAAELRVVGGCPKAHDALDESRACDGASAELLASLAETYAEALTARCPIDPPEHIQLEARGELL